MLERLAEYVEKLPEDKIGDLLIQDIALCQAWSAAGAIYPGEKARAQVLAKQAAAWQRRVHPPDEKTDGRRHQWLLRGMIEKLSTEPREPLDSDEASFLRAVQALLKGMAHGKQFDRLRELLAPHADSIERRAAERRSAPGLPLISRRIQYATSADIEAAPQRETRLLAGIELPCRGPVLTCPCHLRVLGDVPDRCTVVVEGEGACSVDGYILGRVLVKQGCEVRGNIAGVAIVLYGDIRARGIINNGYAVAKMGSVLCRSAQGPRLVFAGREITIAESAMLGRYISRVVNVGREICGGQVHVSERAQAPWFRHLGPNDLRIVLRRELCCEDYGEVTGEELNRLLSDAYRLRSLAHNLDIMADLSRREAEHTAQSTLMFLFGGSETHKKLVDIAAAHRRLDAVARLTNNLRAVLESTQDGLMRKLELIPVPDHDVMDMDRERMVDRELARESEDAASARPVTAARRINPVQAARIVADVGKKLQHLTKERASIEKTIAKREKEMQSLEQYETLLKSSGKATTKLELLVSILPTLRKQPESSPIAARLKSPFVEMALRNIDRRLRNGNEYREQSVTYRRGFLSVSERLGREFQIRMLENPGTDDDASRVTGRFERGIKIYMDMYADNELELPPNSLIRTPSGNEPRTYVRMSHAARFHVHSTDVKS